MNLADTAPTKAADLAPNRLEHVATEGSMINDTVLRQSASAYSLRVIPEGA